MPTLATHTLSTTNQLVARQTTDSSSHLLDGHPQLGASPTANAASPIRRLADWLRGFAFLLGSPAALIAPVALTAAPAVQAQELYAIQGEYGSHPTLLHLNVNASGGTPVITSFPLLAIPVDERARGLTPIVNGETSATELIVYTEATDGTAHLWKVVCATAVATIECFPLLWGDPSDDARPANMVGYARTPSIAPMTWCMTVGEDGSLYEPIDCSGLSLTGSGPAPTAGSLPFPGPVVGAVHRGGHLWVVSQNSTLRKVSVSPTNPGFAPSTAPTLLQSWTLPVTGQVLGFTVSSDGYFYALVNRVTDGDSGCSGYVELVRSTQSVDVAVGTLTFVSVGTHIQDWGNDGGGPTLFPAVHLAFTDKAAE